jgi:hypothetical protein
MLLGASLSGGECYWCSRLLRTYTGSYDFDYGTIVSLSHTKPKAGSPLLPCVKSILFFPGHDATTRMNHPN